VDKRRTRSKEGEETIINSRFSVAFSAICRSEINFKTYWADQLLFLPIEKPNFKSNPDLNLTPITNPSSHLNLLNLTLTLTKNFVRWSLSRSARVDSIRSLRLFGEPEQDQQSELWINTGLGTASRSEIVSFYKIRKNSFY